MGEGSDVLVLEELEHAKERNASDESVGDNRTTTRFLILDVLSLVEKNLQEMLFCWWKRTGCRNVWSWRATTFYAHCFKML